jgi:DNA-binding transcriptional LysR family regulator
MTACGRSSTSSTISTCRSATLRRLRGAGCGFTAPLTFGALQLTPALNDFAARYPEIGLDVSFSDRVASLVDEGFDMAVRVGRPGDSSVVSRRLCEVRIIVVGAPAYLDRRGEPATPEDLSRHECVIDTNFRDPNRWPFGRAATGSGTERTGSGTERTGPRTERTGPGTERTVPVSGRIRYSNAEACLSAAEAGLGLACVPAFVAGEAIRSGRLKRLLGAYESAPYGVHALYPHHRHLAAKVRVLVDFLVARYRGPPEWEAGP